MLDKQFSTPIYCKDFSRFESQIIQREIDDIVNNIKFDKVPNWSSHNHSISDPTFSTSLFDQYTMLGTVEIINRTVEEYFNALDYSSNYNLNIKECWLTETRKNEYTVPHNHGSFDISGVYYYATNSNDGDIHFINPAPITDTTKFINDTQYIKYVPKVGRLILFPGWLTHFVNENETDSKRMSLSFNIQIEEQ